MNSSAICRTRNARLERIDDQCTARHLTREPEYCAKVSGAGRRRQLPNVAGAWAGFAVAGGDDLCEAFGPPQRAVGDAFVRGLALDPNRRHRSIRQNACQPLARFNES